MLDKIFTDELSVHRGAGFRMSTRMFALENWLGYDRRAPDGAAIDPRRGRRRVRMGLGLASLASSLLLSTIPPLAAQTDYYNTDTNRPVRIEDAYSTERYAFELKVAPLRVERESGGVYHWGIDPEIAYGILPRTHVEVGFPFSVIDAGDAGRRSGLAGIELSALHTLNVETGTLPAFGIRGDLVLPIGGLASDRAHPAITGIVTRTFRWARFHVNGQYTFGGADGSDDGADPLDVAGGEVSRWLAGLAVDRVFPLSSLLAIADVYVSEPLNGGPVEWNTGIGVRYQVNPYLAVDVGVGRRLTGNPSWHFTFGSAYAFALRPLIPIPSR